MRHMVVLWALAPVCACGARSDVVVSEAGEPSDGSIVDRDPTRSSRFDGVWRLHTVRAICDTLAIAFCDDDARVRLSLNDACNGENPIGAAPSVARVVWVSPSEAQLFVDLGGAPAMLRVRLTEAVDPRDDQLQLIASDAPVPEFPWGAGVREGTDGVMVLPPGFIDCE